MSDPGQAQAAVATTVKELGRLDTLINNAGVMLLGPIVGAPLEEWQRMVNLNVLGLLYCTHAALPHLIAAAEGDPRSVADVVNISSTAGRVARLNSGVYNATKFGVVAFSESLRQEVTTRHVRVTIIEPGATATELASHNRPVILEGMAKTSGGSSSCNPRTSPGHPLRLTQPRHVAVNEIYPSDRAGALRGRGGGGGGEGLGGGGDRERAPSPPRGALSRGCRPPSTTAYLDLELAGTVTMITGGTDGLGLALARRLVAEGGAVAVCGRDEARLAAAVPPWRPTGATCWPGGPMSTPRHRGLRRRRGGPLGPDRRGGAQRRAASAAGTWRHRRRGVARRPAAEADGGRAADPAGAAPPAGQRGAALFTLAMAAKAPGAGSEPSSVTRAAGMALMKALSKELAPDGIRVNAVLIGLIESGQWVRRAGAAAWSPRVLRPLRQGSGIPLGRVGRAEEFADLGSFLLSARASYLTGAAINLDGGLSRPPSSSRRGYSLYPSVAVGSPGPAGVEPMAKPSIMSRRVTASTWGRPCPRHLALAARRADDLSSATTNTTSWSSPTRLGPVPPRGRPSRGA